MFSALTTYLQLGFRHILDLNGYDHILFVVALVAGEGKQWRRLLWLVTAFTVGHSVTLALATLDLVRADPAWIEFLIPVTIVLTSAINIAELRAGKQGVRRAEAAKYGLTLGFGLIHGLGFSNFLRAALGGEESIVVPLLGFNVGVELGQLLIVACALLLGRLVAVGLRINDRIWLITLSIATGLVALQLLLERMPF